MAQDRIKLEVTRREELGSRASRRLRRTGLVPGVLYGSGKPLPFVVGERDLRHALGGEHGRHAILDVVLAGQQKTHHAVLKDFQLDPRRSTVVHVDLHEVRLDRPISAQVAIELVGQAKGVAEGGILTQVLREANVEALPGLIPDRLELDVSEVELGASVHVRDISAPEGVTILDDPELLVGSVSAPRRAALLEEVPEEELAGLGEAEAAEAEAGEAAAAEAESSGE